MKEVFSSFIWMVIGIFADRFVDKIVFPHLLKLKINKRKKQSQKLYSGEKTFEYMRNYYGNQLYNCKIQNVSVQIPYLVNNEWSRWNIDVFSNPDILTSVNTNECTYPINMKFIKEKLKEGKRIENNPSLFLHSIQCSKEKLKIEVGEYPYFQRISFVYDLEKETYSNVYGKWEKRDRLRNMYLPRNISSTFVSQNTIPLGADAAIIIRRKGKYQVCIHKRSDNCANYQKKTMVVPSFGFGKITNVDNPLLYSFFSEFSEELFDREEMEIPDNYLNPTWFYQQYEEIVELLELKESNELEIKVIGAGLDTIGGFFNINLMVVIHSEKVSNELYNHIHGNWETCSGSIRFISLDSYEIADLLKNNQLAPSTAFTIARAIEVLSV